MKPFRVVYTVETKSGKRIRMKKQFERLCDADWFAEQKVKEANIRMTQVQAVRHDDGIGTLIQTLKTRWYDARKKTNYQM